MVLQSLDITLIFHGDLAQLLGKKKSNRIVYPLTRRASIKDIIESCGVPHTEIGSMSFRGGNINFDFIPKTTGVIDIIPVSTTSISSPAGTLLRPPPSKFRFMVDINVAKLVPLLRMSGLSADLIPVKPERKLAQVASMVNDRQCILLTRNRELLKMKAVEHARLLRNQQPIEQLKEVIELYGLQSELKPFSRCMACNGLLKKVAKSDIEHRLLPLTQKYYFHFKQCISCQKVFWRGSHYERMANIIESIV